MGKLKSTEFFRYWRPGQLRELLWNISPCPRCGSRTKTFFEGELQPCQCVRRETRVRPTHALRSVSRDSCVSKKTASCSGSCKLNSRAKAPKN